MLWPQTKTRRIAAKRVRFNGDHLQHILCMVQLEHELRGGYRELCQARWPCSRSLPSVGPVTPAGSKTALLPCRRVQI